MGVSLETYRSRIGTFSNKNSIKSKMSDISVSKCEQNKRKLDYKLFLIFAIVVAYSSICPVDVLSQSSNHSGGRSFHPSGRIVNSDHYLKIPCGRSAKFTSYINHPSGRSCWLPKNDYLSDIWKYDDIQPCGRNFNSFADGGKIATVKQNFRFDVFHEFGTQQLFQSRNLFAIHWKICFIIIQNNENLRGSTFQEMSNFLAHYTYGNRRNNGIKLAHWNGGSSYLMNKQADIENIIAGYKPHVLGISENCFKSCHNVEDVCIDQYETIFSKTLLNQSLNCSRIAVYVDKEISKKVRLDLMSDTFSSVWLELGHPRQKKILVCQLYRDWAYLNQPDGISGSTQAQLARWVEFLDQWEAALSENKEVVVLGDCNLNFLTFNEACNDQSADAQTNKLKYLVQALFSRIIPLGVTQCVQAATRFWPGHTPSGLDHLYTTNPSKLCKQCSKVGQITNLFSQQDFLNLL